MDREKDKTPTAPALFSLIGRLIQMRLVICVPSSADVGITGHHLFLCTVLGMSIGKTEVGTTTVPSRRPFGSLITCGGTIGRVDGRIPSSIRSTVSDHNHVGWRLDEGFGRLTIPGFLTVRLQVSTKSLIRFDEFVDTTPVVIAAS